MKEEPLPITTVNLFGSRGVFIVNEGNYLYGNSSLCYYDIDKQEITNDIFTQANGIPLGDVAYSMSIYDGRGYIVVNNSGCIQVVDASTLIHIGKIEGLPSPRFMLPINDNIALVSDLYARGISIVNLKNLSVIGKISTGNTNLPFYQHSTENLIRVGNKVFTNCWSFDSKILVISIENFSVIDSIDVGVQPLSMQKDKFEKLWVINDGGYPGNPFGHEKPSLMRINSQTHIVEQSFYFPTFNTTVGQLGISPQGDFIYFIANDIFKMSVLATELPSEPFVYKKNRNLRALAIDPHTGELYISDAVDFMSEGRVFRYSVSGLPIDSINVGIIPGGFCFN